MAIINLWPSLDWNNSSGGRGGKRAPQKEQAEGHHLEVDFNNNKKGQISLINRGLISCFHLTMASSTSAAAAEVAVNETMAEEAMAANKIFADPAMEAAVRKGKMTLKSVLTEFAEWTAIPGPIQLVYALNTFTRVLWLIIWLAAFGIFVYEVYLIVDQYLSYNASIGDALQFEAKRFPVLTVCNQNPYKLTVVRSNPNFGQLRLLMDDYQLVLQNGYANISNDHFGINKAPTRFQKERFARRAQMLLAAQLSEPIRRMATYSFEETVGFTSERVNFTSFLDPVYGACYQLNVANQSDNTLLTLRPGNGGGLRLLLRAMQTDPATGAALYLPTTTVAGIRLSVEMANVPPAMDDIGLSIGTGREVMLAMENTKTALLKEPYGICRDGTEQEGLLNFYGPEFAYTIQSCLRSCRQNRAIQQCGCVDPRFPRPPTTNASLCTVEDVFCLLQLDSEAQATERFSPIRDCGCRPACRSQLVDLHTSQGSLTSMSSSISYICQGRNSLFSGSGAATRCAQWYRQNGLLLNLWFDGLDFIQHTQRADYTLVRASNDLGGQMGLWLGVCFISIFEVLTLLLMTCLYFTRGRKVRVVPSEVEKARDSRNKNLQELRRELDIHEGIDARIRRKIDRQRRERYQKRRQAEADLDRAELYAAETEERARQLVEMAGQNEEDTKLRAEAANAVALAHGARLRIRKLRELVAIYSV